MTNTGWQFFSSIESSSTSDDGQHFILHVKRPTQEDVHLAFRHHLVHKIIQHASVQAPNCRDETGRPTLSAFKATSFEIGSGPAGEPVLTLVVGQAGTISFLLPKEIVAQLLETLNQRFGNASSPKFLRLKGRSDDAG